MGLIPPRSLSLHHSFKDESMRQVKPISVRSGTFAELLEMILCVHWAHISGGMKAGMSGRILMGTWEESQHRVRQIWEIWLWQARCYYVRSQIQLYHSGHMPRNSLFFSNKHHFLNVSVLFLSLVTHKNVVTQINHRMALPQQLELQ